jgi:hypothetical protein
MATTYLFDKVSELKEKFRHFWHHRKKLQALENYSQVVPFQHKDYLILIKRCMSDGFLGEEEAKFLCYMTDKYFSEQNFLDWTHKTKWLKGEISRLADHYQEKEYKQMTFFDFDKLNSSMSSNVPFELLAKHQKQQVSRRV